ncbi:hypothetical protein [Photorhabdus sp. RM96S]|uniref:hypothetical protein n=1 Tax=Photorhabdus sp. RM96S TaxID=3342822 RepID=UPI0036DC83E9
MTLANLLNSLQAISAELIKNGKGETAYFFIKRYDEIIKSNNEQDSIRQIVKELSTCQAMAQYGDFSPMEEKLLESVVKDAINFLDHSL